MVLCLLQLWLPNGDPELVTELGAAAPNSDNTRKKMIYTVVQMKTTS